MRKLDYEKPSLQYWEASQLNAIEATMSGGGGGGGSISKPSMASCLANNFRFVEDDEDDGNGWAAVMMEYFWDRICEVYASASLEYRNWLFFRALGDFGYGMSYRNGVAWSAFAGPFSGLDELFYDSLDMEPGTVEIIRDAVICQIDDDNIDFPHMCIVAATHLAADLGFCSAVVLASLGLTTTQDILNVAGWGGDASIPSPTVSFPNSDSMADMDAVNLAEKLKSGYSVRTALQSYYSSDFNESKRVSLFKSAVHSSRSKFVEDIIFYQILFGTSPSSVANLGSAEAEYYLQSMFPEVYDNFLEKL